MLDGTFDLGRQTNILHYYEVMRTGVGVSQRRNENDGQQLLESAIVGYTKDLVTTGILPRDTSMHDGIESVKALVRRGCLVPCVLTQDQPCILFVPRTPQTVAGPVDPFAFILAYVP